MGIPTSRIDQSRQLDKKLVRKRRQNTRQKDWHKKDNLHYHPEGYMRVKAWMTWDNNHRNDDYKKKWIIREIYLQKEFKKLVNSLDINQLNMV